MNRSARQLARRQCLAWRQQTSEGCQRPATLAAWHEAWGSAALATGQAALAAEQLEQAAEQWGVIGHPFDRIRALAGLSQARRSTGDVRGAAAAREASLGLAPQPPSDELRAAFTRSATRWAGASPPAA